MIGLKMSTHETDRIVRQTLHIANNMCYGKNIDAELMQSLKCLRNDCARGAYLQEFITSHTELNEFLYQLLFTNTMNSCLQRYDQINSMALQLLANAVVNNATTQRCVWLQHGQYIIQHCENTPLSRSTDIQLMILYNIFRGTTGVLSEQQALLTIVRIWQKVLNEKCNINLEFLHFFFEYFLVQEGRITVRCYARLEPNERITFLDYLVSYLRHDSPNGVVNSFLLQYISKEFKVKSDFILRESTAQEVDSINPNEAYSLLRVIACATGSETYAPIYETDHSLFLNVSSVLRCLVAMGKDTKGNIFVPMNKLEEVATSSKIPYDFESDISFELKTLLVRCIANLLYKNKINKGYCLDTAVMPVLFECTNVDARNPLIKEWSILAIRNACEDSKEVQEVIANLRKRGDVGNDIIRELNLEMGALRITCNKD